MHSDVPKAVSDEARLIAYEVTGLVPWSPWQTPEMRSGLERLRLSERRAVLDNVETITGYARDMRNFLRESKFTEARPFMSSLAK